MVTIKVEYRVKQKKIDECLDAIETFVDALREHEPDTLLYDAYQHSDDPQEFVHLMQFEDNAAAEKHRTALYTKEFVSLLYPNCEKEPVFTELTTIATADDD